MYPERLRLLGRTRDDAAGEAYDKVARLLSGKLATTAVDSLMIVFYASLMFLYDVLMTVLVIALGLTLLSLALLVLLLALLFLALVLAPNLDDGSVYLDVEIDVDAYGARRMFVELLEHRGKRAV